MNLVNPGRSILQKVPGLNSALDKILARITALWSAEHNPDGTHSNVTASGDVGIGGALRLTNYQTIASGAGVDLHDLKGRNPNGLISVFRIDLTSSGAIDLTGIDSTGRQMGDVVMICNVVQSVDSLTILLDDTSSVPPNRFHGNLSIGGDSIVVSPGRFVWAMYDTVSARWRVGVKA